MSGTPLGEAFVTIRPKTDGFEGELQRGVVKSADKAGKEAGRALGHGIESGSERANKSLRLLSKTFTGASAGALGPLQEVADKLEVIEKGAGGASKAGSRLTGLGAAAVGIGGLLASIGSREQGAQQRLAASIRTTGHEFDDYKQGIEGAIKTGEHFGSNSAETLNALNALTIGLHSPEAALKNYNLVQDIAAAKQTSVSRAADIVRQAFNGNTRVLKQFGLQLKDLGPPLQDLTSLQGAASTAQKKVADAQSSFNDKLEVYRSKSKHTLSDQIALRNSYNNIGEATTASKVATDKLAKAQESNAKAGERGARVLERIAAVTKGQADASARTFTGHLKTLGAQIEDTVGKFGKDYGPAVAAAGTAAVVFGQILEFRAVRALAATAAAATAAATTVDRALLSEGAAATESAVLIEAGAAKGSRAMLAEADVAVAASGRIRGAMAAAAGSVSALKLAFGGLAGGVGSLLLTSGDSPDSDRKRTPFQHLIIDVGTRAGLTVKNSTATQRALYAKALTGDRQAAIDYTLQFGVGGSKESLALLAAAGYGSDSSSSASDADVFRNIRAGQTAARLGGGARAGAADDFASRFRIGAPSGGGGGAGRQAAAGVTAALSAFRREVSAEIRRTTTELGREQKLLDAVLGFGESGRQSGLAFGSLSSINLARPDGSSIGSALRGRAGVIFQFTKQVDTLARRGLSKDLLRQVIALGPGGQGSQLAAALVASTPAQLRDINRAEASLASVSSTLGKNEAADVFGKKADQIRAEIAKTNVVLARLERELKTGPAKTGKAVGSATRSTTAAASRRTTTGVRK